MTPQEKLAKANELLTAGLINEQDFESIKYNCLRDMGLLPAESEGGNSASKQSNLSIDAEDTARWNELENELNTAVEGWEYGYEPFVPESPLTRDNIKSQIAKFEAYIKDILFRRKLATNFQSLALDYSIEITDPPPLGSSDLILWLRHFFLKFSKAKIKIMQYLAEKGGFVLKDPPSLETDGSYESLISIQRSMKVWLEDYHVREEAHQTKKLQASLKEAVKDWAFDYRPYPSRKKDIEPEKYQENFANYIEYIKEEIKMYAEIKKLADFSSIELSTPPPLGSSKMETWLKDTYSHVSQKQIERFETMSKTNGFTLSPSPVLDPESPNFDLRTKQKEVVAWLNKSLKAITENTEKLKKEAERLKKESQKKVSIQTEEQAIAQAKRTGKNVRHPTNKNVLLMPDGNMIPESGFMWSGFWSKRAIPIPKHPFLRRKKLSEMPKVNGAVSSPGGFFFRARLYRVQFFIDQIKEGDPGGLVVATSPYQAVGAIFRDDETNRVALSWHKVDNIARQLFITLAGVLYDFEAAEDYHRPELLYYLDPIGYDIEDAMEKGIVKVTHITSESMLLDTEKGGCLPYNSLSDDYVVEDYI